MSDDQNVGLRCIGEDRVHKSDYIVKVYSVETGGMGEGVAVSWCSECGAVSVDKEYDGRFSGIIRDMQFPKLVSTMENILKSEENK